MKTPILLLVYIKPNTTKKIINVLKKIKAEKIYISINRPPKINNKKLISDNNKVKKIVNSINWKCKVIKKERKHHLDSYNSYKKSVRWFFQKESEGIVLEDDTLPSKDFFEFCTKLLIKYRNNKKISQICGSSFLNEKINGANYKFSNYCFCWGYATWRRSIIDFDDDFKKLKTKTNEEFLRKILNNRSFVLYWKTIFNDLFKKKIQAWDYTWMLSNWHKEKLSIIPKKNLIQNIGFVKEATHTKIKYKDWFTDIKPYKMNFNNIHPEVIKPDLKYDKWVSYNIFKTNKFFFKKLLETVLKI